jgi:hypothetical protein
VEELQQRIYIKCSLLFKFSLNFLFALLSLARAGASTSAHSSFLYSARSSLLWSMPGRLSPDLYLRHPHICPPPPPPLGASLVPTLPFVAPPEPSLLGPALPASLLPRTGLLAPSLTPRGWSPQAARCATTLPPLKVGVCVCYSTAMLRLLPPICNTFVWLCRGCSTSCNC